MQRYDNPNAPAPDPTRRFRCRHIFADGHRCGSPSLRGQHLCYYHDAVHSAPSASSARSADAIHFALPAIDDRSGIQLAIHQVLARIATNEIDPKRAGLLLYGLQIASSNLARQPQPAANEAANEPLVEEIVHNLHLGDLAPIEELPSNPTTELGAPSSTDSLTVGQGGVSRESATNEVPSPTTVSFRPERDSLTVPRSGETCNTMTPLTSEPGARYPTSETSDIEPQTPTDAPNLPTTHYPPPTPLPRYTSYIHDSHPRMAS